MTTIAANRRMLVSDSQVTLVHKGLTYPAKKLVRGPGLIAGCSGDGGDCTRFLKWAQTGFDPKKEPKWLTTSGDDQVFGLVLRADGIYAWSCGDPEPERIEADFFACGSGGGAARVAMMLGKTPQEAVELAAQVDFWTGMPVQTLYLDPDEKGPA